MQDKMNLHQQEQMTIEYQRDIKKSHIMARQAKMHNNKLGLKESIVHWNVFVPDNKEMYVSESFYQFILLYHCVLI